jgi:hypothetical protein
LVVLLGGVHHDHAFVHVHLRGRQAHAFGFVHGLQHVVHQLAHAVVHFGHGPGHGVQAGSGKRRMGSRAMTGQQEKGSGIAKRAKQVATAVDEAQLRAVTACTL